MGLQGSSLRRHISAKTSAARFKRIFKEPTMLDKIAEQTAFAKSIRPDMYWSETLKRWVTIPENE